MNADGSILCLAAEASSELVIKKSRFICALIPAETEKEAAQALARVKKRHYDARHNCSAMIADGKEKSSDDGEPQGTAGAPMLEALRASGLTNVLAVVTRYFGGTLLGTGGLVRAYGGAVAAALETAELELRIPAVILKFRVGYADYGKVQSIAAAYGAKTEAEFGEKVSVRAVLKKSDLGAAEKKIEEAFFGAGVYEKCGDCYITEPVK